MSSNIVTRFAPSPTGLLHMGNYRTAVFAYLFAQKHGGAFILRIEDTDRERSKKEYEDNIIESLAWLNLSYSKFYRQSEHVGSHEQHLKKLIAEGKAYISKEEAKDGSGVMRELVRFKNPNIRVAFDDLIRGRIEMDTTDLGDFVIAKSITEPLFHLAIVVDDHEEGVTHIIRGEDHIPNTPRQILIREAFGFPQPVYAHLPLVLAPDRTKLSKRKGALPVSDYRDRGYLPEALINFMAFIGWNPGGEQEIFSPEELVELFDLAKVHKGGAVFNEEKLNWMNKEHIKRESLESQQNHIKPFFENYSEELLARLHPLIIERITHYGELKEIESEFSFFKKLDTYEGSLLLGKDGTKESAMLHLQYIKELIETHDMVTPESIKEIIFPYADEKGRGLVLWPLRVALSGRTKSPDPFTIISVLGKEESITRIKDAIKQLENI